MPTLLDKIWDNHLVRSEQNRPDLIYIDKHLVHEVTSPQAFSAMRRDGRQVRRPDLTWAVCDHVVPTTHMARPLDDEVAETQMAALEQNTKDFGVLYFAWGENRQGVIHVTMPEQGIVLPGNTVVAGDSHTATHGAFGALAFGIGTSEVEHVLATQTLPQTKPPLHGRGGRGRAARRMRGQGHHPGHHRPTGQRRSHRFCRRVHGPGHQSPVHGRAHDPVQHEHRGRGPARAWWPRTRPPLPG